MAMKRDISAVRPTASIGVGERRRGQRAGPGGAVGEDPVDLGGVGAKLDQPLAERRDQRDQRIGQRRLERAEALAGEIGEHRLDASRR